MKKSFQSAQDFLDCASYFQLGELQTEKPHPLTKNLAECLNEDLPQAVSLLKKVDLQALNLFEKQLSQVELLSEAIKKTLELGNKVFLCGCGATGRLSLSLEYLAKKEFQFSEQVVSFMAGGDVALVHAIEGFEDFSDFGGQQLMDLGFQDGDLLVASTEGGETPFVIGATEKAVAISSNKPFFMYCNPKDQLIKVVDRSKQIINNSKVNDQCYYVGSMALAGSTRMQASTVLQLAIGLALFFDSEKVKQEFLNFKKHIEELDFKPLVQFINQESEAYLRGDKIIYSSTEYAISVFTDTTERAPTFSLTPFRPVSYSGEDHSLCYLMVKGTKDIKKAWQTLLARSPRTLDWDMVSEKVKEPYLLSFDFSENVVANRKERFPEVKHLLFEVYKEEDNLVFTLERLKAKFSFYRGHSLFEHLQLKLLINILSTLLMGKLGRYRHNLMTYVHPTNGKLIDRACRYVQILLMQDYNLHFSYEEIVNKIFEIKPQLDSGESIVLKVVEALRK